MIKCYDCQRIGCNEKACRAHGYKDIFSDGKKKLYFCKKHFKWAGKQNFIWKVGKSEIQFH